MKLVIPFQRFVACLLVFAMAATSFTTAAFATTQGEGRGADYNAELCLAALLALLCIIFFFA
ncbi:hypothetical protein B1A99_01770 [Cohnella sp. CIP 111063]|nr:hypothetical protein B1A99_01770 [Cohnella sp. CIP 111063]